MRHIHLAALLGLALELAIVYFVVSVVLKQPLVLEELAKTIYGAGPHNVSVQELVSFMTKFLYVALILQVAGLLLLILKIPQGSWLALLGGFISFPSSAIFLGGAFISRANILYEHYDKFAGYPPSNYLYLGKFRGRENLSEISLALLAIGFVFIFFIPNFGFLALGVGGLLLWNNLRVKKRPKLAIYEDRLYYLPSGWAPGLVILMTSLEGVNLQNPWRIRFALSLGGRAAELVINFKQFEYVKGRELGGKSALECLREVLVKNKVMTFES